MLKLHLLLFLINRRCRSTASWSVLVAAAAYSCYWRKKALLLHQRNTMNANAIKAAAKPLGMLAVRRAAPSQSHLLRAH